MVMAQAQANAQARANANMGVTASNQANAQKQVQMTATPAHSPQDNDDDWQAFMSRVTAQANVNANANMGVTANNHRITIATPKALLDEMDNDVNKCLSYLFMMIDHYSDPKDPDIATRLAIVVDMQQKLYEQLGKCKAYLNQLEPNTPSQLQDWEFLP